ncbi:MAG: glycosyltransferase family 2 protein [Bacteroidota bacterium]
MLSILIPTYNYNVLPLVQELQFQAKREHIEFEIIVLDDASTDNATISKNQQIGLIDNCKYKLLQQNIGRSKIRNLLAKKAQYNWLLFLDADTMSTTPDLICQYLQYLNAEEKAVYGGIEYQHQKPPREKLLRWVYGRDREALHVGPREDMPYRSFLTLNFAISKSIFNKVSFNEEIPNLRYEDVLFAYNLSEKNIKVQHIHNPVCHNGLETGEIFLRKTEEATQGLKYLIDNNLLPADYIRLGAAYCRLKKFGMAAFAAKTFNTFKQRLRKNLLGAKPSMIVFDLYRLGYLCTLK